jgi:hypothetical protein
MDRGDNIARRYKRKGIREYFFRRAKTKGRASPPGLWNSEQRLAYSAAAAVLFLRFAIQVLMSSLMCS